ncbi:DNA mismatch repair protein Msh3-like [Mizuhopecten yessoensis]|uniref:DNA mismatch repair protein n=1 Tax=Mizuhopecten yessoensis TaxID=6573 RepID=A0A210QDR9_MIZYE|nr:DNA mismatch repair protein Msh3-like [Mizuhopecten yessoensis]OWF46885.1 DNA mismatch repair protein Msh3 [Mizuhopecten yessoensis]
MSARKSLTNLKPLSHRTNESNANEKKQVTISKFFASKSAKNDSELVIIDNSSREGSADEKKVSSTIKKRRRKKVNDSDDNRSKKQCLDDGGAQFSEKEAETGPSSVIKVDRLRTDEASNGEKSTEREKNDSRSHCISPGVEHATSLSENTKHKLQQFESSVNKDGDSNSGEIISISELKRNRNLPDISSVSSSLSKENDLEASKTSDSDDEYNAPGTSKSMPASSTLTKIIRKSSSTFASNSTFANKTTKTPTSAGKKGKYTPLEQQFVDIKDKCPHAVLCVECGYRYRFFGQDAEIAAEVLNIFCHLDHNFMTASIPTHRLFVHVRRLVAAGYKVGVVKQMETAALKAAGDNRSAPFTRELSALYTKSTLIGEDVNPLLNVEDTGDSSCGTSTSYLMCVYEAPPNKNSKQHTTAIFAIQPSTGDVVYDSFEDNAMHGELETRLFHIQPSEILISDDLHEDTDNFIQRLASISCTPDDRMRVERIDGQQLEYNTAFQTVSKFYTNENIAGISLLQEVLSLPRPVISCLAGTISYLSDFNLDKILTLTSNFTQFSVKSKFMQLPGNTVRNLEMFQNQTNGSERGSLFRVMNQTVSRFGGRMLRMWLSRPLLSASEIKQRHAAVQDLIDGPCAETMAKLRAILGKSPDLEKGLASIYHKKCSVVEFYLVCKALSQLQKDVQLLARSQCPQLNSHLLKTILTSVPDLLQDAESFVSSIREKSVRDNEKTQLFADEGKFPLIPKGKQAIQEVMSEIQAHRREVRLVLRLPALEYVTVMGTEFLIEVKNNSVHLVPKDWIKISSTKAVSRFHSPFIEKTYRRLQQLREQLKLDCHRVWLEFLSSFGENYQSYKKAVQHLATLDCLFSLAAIAKHHDYCRPEIVDDDEFCIHIENGRHPIIQQLIGEHEQYVPNHTRLSRESDRVMIITGPNMGGKSSYIKQVALIAVMAQIGSYVPAESARLGILDAVYTRMGASDEIYSRRSTFMVELQEASDIIANATDRSLVILDELGRGTSTHDGTAIALATLDYFIQKVKCLCLFVTHYPMLSEFEHKFPGIVQNFHMSFFLDDEEEIVGETEQAVNETSAIESITFLYQLVVGVAGRSYGLNVARLAGIPHDIIQQGACQSKYLEAKIMERREQLKLFQAMFTCPKTEMADILQELQKSEDQQMSSST